MTSASKFWLPDFDPNRTFIVAAWPLGFTVAGKQPQPGEIFDKHILPLNRLRAHYEARWIRMAEPHELAPGHTDLMVTPEAIDAFLEANPPPADEKAAKRAERRR